MLAPLDDLLVLLLADGALHPEHDLLRRLGLLLEDGLGLTTEAGLLSIVTPLTYAIANVV